MNKNEKNSYCFKIALSRDLFPRWLPRAGNLWTCSFPFSYGYKVSLSLWINWLFDVFKFKSVRSYTKAFLSQQENKREQVLKITIWLRYFQFIPEFLNPYFWPENPKKNIKVFWPVWRSFCSHITYHHDRKHLFGKLYLSHELCKHFRYHVIYESFFFCAFTFLWHVDCHKPSSKIAQNKQKLLTLSDNWMYLVTWWPPFINTITEFLC